MKTTFRLFLISMLLAPVAAYSTEPTAKGPAASASRESTDTANLSAAISSLRTRLIRDKVYSAKSLKLVFFDGYLYQDLAYLIDIRANPNKTNTEPSRIDSFLVFPDSDVILWSTPEGSWHSWHSFLLNRRKLHHENKRP